MRARSVSLISVLALTACGDDGGTPPDAPPVPIDAAVDARGGTAADYQGLWLMTQLIFDDEGTPRTVRRDGVPQAIRGDVVVTATGARTATLEVRQALLDEGLLAGPVFAAVNTVAVEPDRWVITDADGEVTVFETALGDQHLILTHDADDPRDTAEDPPVSVIVDQAEPWSTALVGTWDLVSITSDGVTRPGDTCLEVSAGTWGMLTMLIDIDHRGLFSRVLTMRQFSDDTCVTQTAEATSTQVGFGEEEDGIALRMWAIEGDRSELQAFSFAVVDDVATLTRTACLPTPDCLDEAPTEVVVRRHVITM